MRTLKAVLIFWFYRALMATWRIRIEQDPKAKHLIESKASLILAHWHGDELALLHLVRRFNLATMTSTSRDGQVIDYLIHRLGGSTTRGSSTRGGIPALIGLVRLCRSGRTVSFAVDGPRGPIHQPKPGVFELSRLCRAQVIPVGVFARPVMLFKKSWNQAFLPYPFAHVTVYLGAPIKALDESEDARDELRSRFLAREIFAAGQQAAKIIATN